MSNIKIQNKKAYHDYHILEKFEAGIVLVGCEIKSIRLGNANLRDAYARIINNELWLFNAYIAPFFQGNRHNPESTRDRKLLLHRAQINKLIGKVEEKGYTLIPLNLHFSKNKIKLDLGLAKAKKLHDKRQALKEKAIKRDLQQEFKSKYH